MKTLTKWLLIIGSVFAFLTTGCLWTCVFVGINGEILVSITTLSFGYLSVFLYGIVNQIKSRKVEQAED